MNKITAIPAKFVTGDVAMQLVNNGISFKLNMNTGHLPGDTLGNQWNTTLKTQNKIIQVFEPHKKIIATENS